MYAPATRNHSARSISLGTLALSGGYLACRLAAMGQPAAPQTLTPDLVWVAAVAAVSVLVLAIARLAGNLLRRAPLTGCRRAVLALVALGLPFGLLPSGSNSIAGQGRFRIGAPLATREGPDYLQYVFERWGIVLEDGTAQWSRDEVKLVYQVLYGIEQKIGEVAYINTVLEMRSAWMGLVLRRMHHTNNPFGNMAWVPPGQGGRYIEVPDYGPENGWWKDEQWTKHILAEELGHAWDFSQSMTGGWNGGQLSEDMAGRVGSNPTRCFTLFLCAVDDAHSLYDAGDEAPISKHAASSPVEDWAGAFAQYVEPLPTQALGSVREDYVRSRMAQLADKIDQP